MLQLKTQLLKPGGLSTSTVVTHEQWDAPNAWAPLQWIAVIGLENYGYFELAHQIMFQWNHNVRTYFNAHKVVLEKYNADQVDLLPMEGEYEVQEGFGWTNGIYLAFQRKLKEN
jgi:alpha,alpha-trehalase